MSEHPHQQDQRPPAQRAHQLEPTRLGDVLWEIPKTAQPGMRVPARIIADEQLLDAMLRDRSVAQLLNVASLPGVTGYVAAMPDMHEGYGFPVGGVAATLVDDDDGVVSPGGIGFDINCGVRLLRTRLDRHAHAAFIEPLVHELSRAVPTGYGRQGHLILDDDELDAVLRHGCRHVVGAMHKGRDDDLLRIESGGCLPGADPHAVSERARERGRAQLGTLGGGNHFLEVQAIDAIYDADAAAQLGLRVGDVTVLLHTGSRGLGHQVCSDATKEMDAAMARYGIEVPDRQLACAPIASAEGKRYLAAMAAAANFAWANRQVLTHRVRQALGHVAGGRGPDVTVDVVYDVAHNIAKLEEHDGKRVCVHRKGATRAFGPSSAEVPIAGLGQPIFIPGSMGTASFVLVGEDGAAAVSWSSTCHGAGRALSRHAAKRAVEGHVLRKELEAKGIIVRCPSNAELAEEAPLAYKDVERVVDVVARAGIARKVARLVPLGVLKG